MELDSLKIASGAVLASVAYAMVFCRWKSIRRTPNCWIHCFREVVAPLALALRHHSAPAQKIVPFSQGLYISQLLWIIATVRCL